MKECTILTLCVSPQKPLGHGRAGRTTPVLPLQLCCTIHSAPKWLRSRRIPCARPVHRHNRGRCGLRAASPSALVRRDEANERLVHIEEPRLFSVTSHHSFNFRLATIASGVKRVLSPVWVLFQRNPMPSRNLVFHVLLNIKGEPHAG